MARTARIVPKNARPFSSMQLRVELREIRPAIWRQLVVPARMKLDLLHEVLQLSFGWQDSHLHEFECGGVHIGPAHLEDTLIVDEAGAPLGALAAHKSRMLYRYDFGDDWEHASEEECARDEDRERRDGIQPPHGGRRFCNARW